MMKKINTLGIFKGSVVCSKNLKDCLERPDLGFFEVSTILGNCFEHKYVATYSVDDKTIVKKKFLYIGDEIKSWSKLKPEYINKEVKVILKFTDEKNENCIRNYKYFKLYELFPAYFEFLFDLKETAQLGSNVAINPFINGEASISNIVKRFPVNFVFKPLLFISVIFMYLYWKSYNYLFAEILNSKKNKFFLFGIASAVFLFFHVLFLGMDIDNKIFKLLRKLIIVAFILSEIFAQFILSIQLFKNKKNLSNYCNTYIINIKLLFVISIAIISLLVIFILLTYDLTSKVDYILEWNYFAGLLFYYLLSALMWKKLTSNPTSTQNFIA